ncbi:MAG: DUF853 family protein [Thiotrichales bacterium]|nr:DUF853 family protein [Thiotrichales bacterium]
MQTVDPIFIGRGEKPVHLTPALANRHGLIAGATGTGKTVTLQILAEAFSNIGVPVFMADVKGDLSGISQAGVSKDFLEKRANTIGLENYEYKAFPTIFWDLYGELGHPIRTTVSEMGPLLLSRLLDLNETQEGVLNIGFKISDDEGLLLLDLKDLRQMMVYLAENASDISTEYGNVSKASIGAIQRRLLVLEQQDAEHFFGEPALELSDMMRTTSDGKGIINILSAVKLINSPKLFSTFLLWLLSELFEELPEIGDPDKPRLVFFFDEAHLLFNDTPKALVEKVEQVVRLIRSKGVGIYFVTQNPLDIPDSVLAQLGNRVQHALRAFTPRDQKAVRAVAETFRQNPKFSTKEVITTLGVGEALVSTLQKKGIPSVVEQTLIRPPSSRLGPATDAEQKQVIKNSPLLGKYDQAIDRESAYEVLKKRAKQAQEEHEKATKKEASRSKKTSAKKSTSRRQSASEAFFKSAARSIGAALGSKMVRGLLGSLIKRALR